MCKSLLNLIMVLLLGWLSLVLTMLQKGISLQEVINAVNTLQPG